MKNIKPLLFFLMIFTLASCGKNFLDRRPLDNLTDANYYQNSEQLLKATTPLYNAVWLSYNFKAIQSVEQRANTLFWNDNPFKEFNASGSSTDVLEAWQSFFNVVGQANLIIENIKVYTPSSVAEKDKNNAIAEARFMRGLAYSMLVQLWGAVPVLENNLTLLTDTSKRRNTIESVWDFIMADMRYAAKNLHETSANPGRLNKYAGQAMLARMFLTHAGVNVTGGAQRRQSDLDSAAYYCRSVIANGPYKLLSDYEELFKMKNNNNAESILALQWVFNGGWGTQNATQSYLAFSGTITGVGDGWGSQIGAGFNTLKLYENLATDKRRRATYMFPGDLYNYIHHDVNGTIRPYLKVPYASNNSYTLSGTNPGSEFAWVKKYVVGRPEDNDGKVMRLGTEINTYMMRFAEVYLTLAEAILGNEESTTNAEALDAVNKIRIRAGLEAKTSITWYDIYKERMLEFAMENISAFDFSRLHYYNSQKAYTMLSEMNRGYCWIIPKPNIDNPVSWEVIDRQRQDQDDFVVVNSSNFYLPLPDAEIVRAPNMLKDPVPYQPSGE